MPQHKRLCLLIVIEACQKTQRKAHCLSYFILFYNTAKKVTFYFSCNGVVGLFVAYVASKCRFASVMAILRRDLNCWLVNLGL